MFNLLIAILNHTYKYMKEDSKSYYAFNLYEFIGNYPCKHFNSLTDYISISYFLAPILLPILAFTKSKKLNLFLI